MKIDEDGNVDFGSVTCPTKWDDVTLEMFQKIDKYYSNKDEKFDVRNVLDIMCNLSRDEIDQLPINFTDKLLNELSFLQTPPNFGEPTASLEIDGVKYTVNVQEKLKLGEFVAVDEVLKSDKFNYAAILAILCRKNGEIYDSKFENEVLPSRISMWEKQPVMEVMKIVAFFLNCYIMLEMPSLLYSEVEEGLNLTQKHIETLRKNGDLSALSTKRLMRKLKKLRKSISSI